MAIQGHTTDAPTRCFSDNHLAMLFGIGIACLPSRLQAVAVLCLILCAYLAFVMARSITTPPAMLLSTASLQVHCRDASRGPCLARRYPPLSQLSVDRLTMHPQPLCHFLGPQPLPVLFALHVASYQHNISWVHTSPYSSLLYTAQAVVRVLQFTRSTADDETISPGRRIGQRAARRWYPACGNLTLSPGVAGGRVIRLCARPRAPLFRNPPADHRDGHDLCYSGYRQVDSTWETGLSSPRWRGTPFDHPCQKKRHGHGIPGVGEAVEAFECESAEGETWKAILVCDAEALDAIVEYRLRFELLHRICRDMGGLAYVFCAWTHSVTVDGESDFAFTGRIEPLAAGRCRLTWQLFDPGTPIAYIANGILEEISRGIVIGEPELSVVVTSPPTKRPMCEAPQ